MKKEKDENKLLVFRRYKKKEGQKQLKHPKLIVDASEKKYGYMGLTENRKNGHHSNIPLEKNPKHNDPRKAYLRKDIKYDDKQQFGHILDNYKLSKKDKQYIIDFIEKHKKR